MGVALTLNSVDAGGVGVVAALDAGRRANSSLRCGRFSQRCFPARRPAEALAGRRAEALEILLRLSSLSIRSAIRESWDRSPSMNDEASTL